MLLLFFQKEIKEKENKENERTEEIKGKAHATSIQGSSSLSQMLTELCFSSSMKEDIAL